MFKLISDLTKFGIVIFVLLTGVAGYIQGFIVENHFSISHFIYFILGLYFISSGSLALNQVQEWPLDKKMQRTSNRPIASGKITPWSGGILAFSFLITGSFFLYKVSFICFTLGWLTVFFYNGLYTYWWKRKWIFAALPGAVPGALPVLMGYYAHSGDLGSISAWYLFLILFIWQMPHFWLLAIKYKDDYSSGNIPTLPVALGLSQTQLQITLYTLLYIAIALLTPWFLESRWAYLFLTVPTSVIGIYFLWRFQKEGSKNWFSFFMWVNLSVLVYLFSPAIDRWKLIMSAFEKF